MYYVYYVSYKMFLASTINASRFVKIKVAHKGLIMSINLSKVKKISEWLVNCILGITTIYNGLTKEN